MSVTEEQTASQWKYLTVKNVKYYDLKGTEVEGMGRYGLLRGTVARDSVGVPTGE